MGSSLSYDGGRGRVEQEEAFAVYRNTTSLFLLCVISLFAPLAASAVTIDTVPVGDVGNANDPTTGNLYGGVDYGYRIGTTEVTNAQYVEFLNAKAASDPLALYSTNMGGDPRGGITRSGVSGSYTYAPKTDMGNKPVNYVSWYDSIRFANWRNNGGQASSDTETGAYTLGALGAGGVPIDGLSITRNVGATWFLPSMNEWYKAAYFQPAAQGGDVDNYWLYPTASNTSPRVATANSVGDISNPGENVANHSSGADWNSQNGNVTTVGSAGPLSQSFYGTSDQGGNVWEWNEDVTGDSFRMFGGGSFIHDSTFMQPWVIPVVVVVAQVFPQDENATVGFRVAAVPEPSSYVLAALGLVGLVVWKRRKR